MYKNEILTHQITCSYVLFLQIRCKRYDFLHVRYACKKNENNHK